MTDIQFTEEQDIVRDNSPKGLYKVVISLGLAKTEVGARNVLVVVAILALMLAVAYPLFFS
jgi:hypothetical protein